jgi:hypothetical protein
LAGAIGEAAAALAAAGWAWRLRRLWWLVGAPDAQAFGVQGGEAGVSGLKYGVRSAAAAEMKGAGSEASAVARAPLDALLEARASTAVREA